MHRFFFRIMDVLDWIEKAKDYDTQKQLSEFAVSIIDDQNVIDVQRQQWENDGEDSNGEIIGIYKKSTEELSMGLKRAGDPWNLNNTGDFWQKTYLNAVIKGKDLEFEYDSNGINKKELFATIKKHGEIENPTDIFGLVETYQIPFIKLIKPKFINQLNEYYNV